MYFKAPLPVVTWLSSNIQHYRQCIYCASGDWSISVVWWVTCSNSTMYIIQSWPRLLNGHPFTWNTHELQVQDCFVHLHLHIYSFFLARQVHIIKSWVLHKSYFSTPSWPMKLFNTNCHPHMERDLFVQTCVKS